jgi:methylated-DNA-[protein]-cysteine S-methyltransferase
MSARTRWWRQDAPVGVLTLVAGADGISRVAFGDHPELGVGTEARVTTVARELDRYFDGRLRRFTVPVVLDDVSQPFRRVVLETLAREVPYGETVSYGELAELAGRPGAARAVGTAMATNPVPIVVPCHRVLAAHGLGGYGPGLDVKRALLAREGVLEP